MIEGDGVDTITRVNKDRVKVKGKCNNSNKPKLKISMFYVNTNLFHNYVQRFVITNL